MASTLGGFSSAKTGGYVYVTPQGKPVASAYVNRTPNTPAYNPAPRPATSSGGGGQVLGAQAPQQQANPFNADAARQRELQEIDNVFGEATGLLNQQEQGVRSGEQDLYNSFTSPYDAQRPLLDQAKAEGLQLNQQQVGQNQQQEANALSSARRLYQELTQGTQQRFGGGNSTSDFANAFMGRQYQQNQGTIQNTAGQNMSKLADAATQIVQQHQAKMQELEQQKQGALAQAKLAFQAKLDAINNARFGLSQNKAQLKLDALKDLKNTIANVQAQALQYQQTLQQQVAQAQTQLAANVQAFKAQAGQAVDVNAIPNAMYSSFSSPQAQQQQQIFGQYSAQGGDDYLRKLYGQQ